MFIRLIKHNDDVFAQGNATAFFGSAKQEIGTWARWHWDGTVLRAEVDRYGFYPLFYATLPNGIVIADSIRSLLMLGASPHFDDEAIAAFLRLGFFLGEDTPFSSVRAFPVGGRLHWSAQRGLVVESCPILRSVRTGVSREGAVDGFVDRFRAAIKRCMPLDPYRTALPLSGGRDSRHIALELQRIGFRPGMVVSQLHFSSLNNEDARIAKLLCDALGWSLVVVPQVADPVASEMEKNERFDCLTAEHAWFLPASRRIAAAGITHLFDGVAGDVLSKGLFVRRPWIEGARAGKFRELFCSLPASGYGAAEVALEKLLNHEYRLRWSLEAGLARMARELTKYLDDDNPMNPFFFWNRTRREIAPFLIRSVPGVEVIAPYLDCDVFDFLWNLPTQLLVDHRLHDEAIAKVAPEYANVPFENKDAPSDPGAHCARLMRGMARRPSFWHGRRLLNCRFLRPRLVRACISSEYARNTQWLAPQFAAWLVSLESLAEEAKSDVYTQRKADIRYE